MSMADYLEFRGRCKELAEAAVAADPSLTLVRGHYYCPYWGEQAHWWTVRADGTIVDPTKNQFPSKGAGVYVPFDGKVVCAYCGKESNEDDFYYEGRYPLCPDTHCAMYFLGLGDFVR